METRRAGAKAGPAATIGAARAPGRTQGVPPCGHEDLKLLIGDYKGFGMISLIRALMFRDCQSRVVAFVGSVLLFGQWVGPVGFISYKLTTELTGMELCERGAGIWAKFVMASVAMIYFARLFIAALSHRERRPQEFDSFNMPRWWRRFRHADLIITSLLFDTMIFLANLLVVFQDRSIGDMVVDVLALEFFTLIDDEFKKAVIEYDSSFLYDMVGQAQPSEVRGPQRESGEYSARSASWTPGTVDRSPLTEALFDPSVMRDFGENRGGGGGRVSQSESPQTCCEYVGDTLLCPFLTVLLVIRAVCRVGGPLCAFVMIFYGPICLGAA